MQGCFERSGERGRSRERKRTAFAQELRLRKNIAVFPGVFAFRRMRARACVDAPHIMHARSRGNASCRMRCRREKKLRKVVDSRKNRD